MELIREQEKELMQLAGKHDPHIYYPAVRRELKLPPLEAQALLDAAALLEAYLSIGKKEYREYGFKDRKELVRGFMALAKQRNLPGFGEMASERSFYRKAREYANRKALDHFNAIKAVAYCRLGNRNRKGKALKLTEKEREFIRAFKRENPMAGYKRVYSALRGEFGTVSVNPHSLRGHIRNALDNLKTAVPGQKPA